uniref:Inner centromere protein, ARK binding region containing protein, putative n=1 Tax=Theileria annulata TaxID=5874 RepID=A0A3B0N4E1_THEAN
MISVFNLEEICLETPKRFKGQKEDSILIVTGTIDDPIYISTDNSNTNTPTNSPTNRIDLPLNGIAQPLNGIDLPLNGIAQPLNGTAQPLNGIAQPLNGTAQPLNGTNLPLNGTAQPLNGTNLPILGTISPTRPNLTNTPKNSTYNTIPTTHTPKPHTTVTPKPTHTTVTPKPTHTPNPIVTPIKKNIYKQEYKHKFLLKLRKKQYENNFDLGLYFLVRFGGPKSSMGTSILMDDELLECSELSKFRNNRDLYEWFDFQYKSLYKNLRKRMDFNNLSVSQVNKRLSRELPRKRWFTREKLYNKTIEQENWNPFSIFGSIPYVSLNDVFNLESSKNYIIGTLKDFLITSSVTVSGPPNSNGPDTSNTVNGTNITNSTNCTNDTTNTNTNSTTVTNGTTNTLTTTNGTIGASTVTKGKGANFTATECTIGKGANDTFTEEKNPNEIAVVTKTGESGTFLDSKVTSTEGDTNGVGEGTRLGVVGRGPDTVTEKLYNYLNEKWKNESKKITNWNNDPLLTTEVLWYINATNKYLDKSQNVCILQKCYCVTPDPNIRFNWNDPRCSIWRNYDGPRPSMGEILTKSNYKYNLEKYNNFKNKLQNSNPTQDDHIKLQYYYNYFNLNHY